MGSFSIRATLAPRTFLRRREGGGVINSRRKWFFLGMPPPCLVNLIKCKLEIHICGSKRLSAPVEEMRGGERE